MLIFFKKTKYYSYKLFFITSLIASDSLFTEKNILNDKEFIPSNINGDYSFIIGGSFRNESSNYPSSSILANLNKINKSDASLIISLGDNYRELTDLCVDNFISSFATKVNKPIINAVGNHDLVPDYENDYFGKDYKDYNSRFGNTYYRFTIQNNLFIILDTELERFYIRGEQLSFLDKSLRMARESKTIQNIFIFSHKNIWIPNLKDDNNFLTEILPKLKNITNKRIIWFSGDGYSNAKKDELYGSNMEFMAVSVDDKKDDFLLEVNCVGENINYNFINLSGKPNPNFIFHQVSHDLPTVEIIKKSFLKNFSALIKTRDFKYGLLFSFIIYFVGSYTLKFFRLKLLKEQ
ncbi:metallophosphoesterase [Candidatus Marinimicrobia bacterium]|nr:metallophosphoesterase [Candidatus Neomarinimicrobiota bacterium]